MYNIITVTSRITCTHEVYSASLSIAEEILVTTCNQKYYFSLMFPVLISVRG
jgi:hypothetical protein